MTERRQWDGEPVTRIHTSLLDGMRYVYAGEADYEFLVAIESEWDSSCWLEPGKLERTPVAEALRENIERCLAGEPFIGGQAPGRGARRR